MATGGANLPQAGSRCLRGRAEAVPVYVTAMLAGMEVQRWDSTARWRERWGAADPDTPAAAVLPASQLRKLEATVQRAAHPRRLGRAKAEAIPLRCRKCSKVVDHVYVEDGVAIPVGDRADRNRTRELVGGRIVERQLTHRFRCRARCGAVYPVRAERLVAATAARPAELVLGVDL